MIRTQTLFAVCVVVLLLLLGSTAHSQPGETEDKTLSPYFFVKSDDPEVDRLPLKFVMLVLGNIMHFHYHKYV